MVEHVLRILDMALYPQQKEVLEALKNNKTNIIRKDRASGVTELLIVNIVADLITTIDNNVIEKIEVFTPASSMSIDFIKRVMETLTKVSTALYEEGVIITPVQFKRRGTEILLSNNSYLRIDSNIKHGQLFNPTQIIIEEMLLFNSPHVLDVAKNALYRSKNSIGDIRVTMTKSYDIFDDFNIVDCKGKIKL